MSASPRQDVDTFSHETTSSPTPFIRRLVIDPDLNLYPTGPPTLRVGCVENITETSLLKYLYPLVGNMCRNVNLDACCLSVCAWGDHSLAFWAYLVHFSKTLQKTLKTLQKTDLQMQRTEQRILHFKGRSFVSSRLCPNGTLCVCVCVCAPMSDKMSVSVLRATHSACVIELNLHFFLSSHPLAVSMSIGIPTSFLFKVTSFFFIRT